MVVESTAYKRPLQFDAERFIVVEPLSNVDQKVAGLLENPARRSFARQELFRLLPRGIREGGV